MASSNDFCCSLFRGTASIRKTSPLAVNPNPLLEMGNITEWNVTHEITEIEQANYQSLGGVACKLEFVDSARVEMTIGCLKARNIALALQGTGEFENVTGATVTNESHQVYEACQVIPFNFVPDPTVAVQVTDSTGATVYVEGVDYDRRASGITILEGTTIPDDSEILVDYAYGNNTVIEALITANSEYELIFDGYDYGDGKEVPTKITFNKVKFAPTESMSIIGDEFMTLSIAGEILKDNRKTGTVSKFYTLEKGENK